MTEIERDGDRILTWRENPLFAAAMLGMWMVIFVPMLIFFIVPMVCSGEPVSLLLSLLVVPFFLGVSGPLGYFSLQLLLNRTEITVSHGHLTRRDHPLGWGSGEEIPIQNVLFLSVDPNRDDDGVMIHELHVYRRNGRRVLLYRSDDASQAEHLQRWVEAALALAAPT